MESVLEYIMLNYTWFLGSAIIILLAIIGRYADETNFGQGKTKEQDIKKDEALNLEDIQKNNEDQTLVDSFEQLPVSEENEPIVNQQENSLETVETFEESFEKFDKEFNELLPKKEIIDDELLDEIDSLSLDKTQKLNLSDIPDLDDVELPKIKTLEPEEQDIWKF